MPCVICGGPKTVRSHLIPRALAFTIRGTEPNLTVLERGADRPRSLQAGQFDDNLLCHDHENITGELDRYGVEFVRRVRDGRSKAFGEGMNIENPDPPKLSRFVHSVIWRAVASPLGNVDTDGLGSRRAAIEDWIFREKYTPTILFCASVRDEHEGREFLTAMMPTRIREQGRWLWQFQVVGCYFTLFIGGAGFPANFATSRADLANPTHIPVIPATSVAGWRGLRTLIQSIKRHPRASD